MIDFLLIFKMNNISIICNSDHHIEKSKLLDSRFESNLSIYLIKKGRIFEKGKDRYSLKLRKVVNNNHIFIFFTLHPNKINLALYKLIREQGKQIVAFQETHQFSMHQGVINNLVLQANLIIATSNYEREMLNKLINQKITDVKSYKWLFNSYHQHSFDSEVKPEGKLNLLVLSAPNSVTASSLENDEIRYQLLDAILKKYPDHDLYIKLHPNEDSGLFHKKLLNDHIKDAPRISIIQNKKDFYNCVNIVERIFVSNQTQTLIDLINTGKVIIYFLSKNNKIFDEKERLFKSFFINGIQFLDTRNNHNLSLISNEILNHDLKTFIKIEREILKNNKNSRYNFDDEILLWEFVNKPSKNFLLIKCKKNIKSFLDTINDKFDTSEIDLKIFESEGLSVNTAIFIIYLRNIFKKREINKDFITANLNPQLTKWFIQYFPFDAIILRQRLYKNSIKYTFLNDTYSLIDASETLLRKKSFYFKVTLQILKWSASGKRSAVKNIIFTLFEKIYEKSFMFLRN